MKLHFYFLGCILTVTALSVAAGSVVVVNVMSLDLLSDDWWLFGVLNAVFGGMSVFCLYCAFRIVMMMLRGRQFANKLVM